VREDAIESERVNALSWQGEVFFRRLINRVDDYGRFPASIAILRASIFPLQLNKVSEKDVEKLLEELEENGILATYEAEGKRFLALAKWEQGRAKTSKHPSPPDDVRKRLQTYVFICKQTKTKAPDSDSDYDSDSDSDTASPWLIDHGLELPDVFKTENCLKAMKTWLDYKSERGNRYKPQGLQSALTTWSKQFTSATFPSAVERSIANNWSGLFQETKGSAQMGLKIETKTLTTDEKFELYRKGLI
jgi:hypothetical protein